MINVKTMFISIAAALFLMAGAATYARADDALVIRQDYGGGVIEYLTKYSAIDQSQGRLKIDGFCISACTLFLGTVPPDRVCATERGLLGFHSASTATPFGDGYSPEATHLIYNIYPPEVRTRLTKEGWDGNEHPDVIYIKATELVKACD